MSSLPNNEEEEVRQKNTFCQSILYYQIQTQVYHIQHFEAQSLDLTMSYSEGVSFNHFINHQPFLSLSH